MKLNLFIVVVFFTSCSSKYWDYSTESNSINKITSKDKESLTELRKAKNANDFYNYSLKINPNLQLPEDSINLKKAINAFLNKIEGSKNLVVTSFVLKNEKNTDSLAISNSYYDIACKYLVGAKEKNIDGVIYPNFNKNVVLLGMKRTHF